MHGKGISSGLIMNAHFDKVSILYNNLEAVQMCYFKVVLISHTCLRLIANLIKSMSESILLESLSTGISEA